MRMSLTGQGRPLRQRSLKVVSAADRHTSGVGFSQAITYKRVSEYPPPETNPCWPPTLTPFLRGWANKKPSNMSDYKNKSGERRVLTEDTPITGFREDSDKPPSSRSMIIYGTLLGSTVRQNRTARRANCTTLVPAALPTTYAQKKEKVHRPSFNDAEKDRTYEAR